MTDKKKLIEVALPVEAISRASRRDKDRKTGTIKNVHKWFAPMPTPAWRALLFAALVDDPGEPQARAELLRLVERLVPPDGGPPPPDALEEARRILEEMGDLPTVLDPFCGAGSTIVEAQRLGFPAIGSDLNPVAVLITRTLTELVPAVGSRSSLHGDAALAGVSGGWLEGFLADLRHYGERVREVARKRVGHLYPPTPGGGTVIAWLWARSVTCPNPACRATLPLYSSPWLSRRKNEERWLKPIIDNAHVRFDVGQGNTSPPAATKVGRGAKFRCLVCHEIAPEEHVKAEGMAGRMGVELMAVVAEENRGRVYLPASGDLDSGAELARPDDAPEEELPIEPRAIWCTLYGLRTQADLYTNRQLHMLGAFAEAVAEVDGWVREDGGDAEYAKAVTTVLGLCVGKLAQYNSTQVRWKIDSRNGSGKGEAAFSRHALPMVWDFVEPNPFGGSAGDWMLQVQSMASALHALPIGTRPARTVQADARGADALGSDVLLATDPPYFDQIGYADLSDYFYVWERRALRNLHPDLFATIATPKEAELIASPYRHGQDADRYFVEGFTTTFRSLVRASRADLPLVVIYAHRQEESEDGGLTSTAWDAMLEALLAAGLGIVGTWPIHATSSSRQIGQGTNALASYVVMVCRPRPTDAAVTDRQGFLRTLRAELPDALLAIEEGAIAPVDLAQAAIGPGMAVFSRYAHVVEASGERMPVRTALALINRVLNEVLTGQDDEFDAETRWAIRWFQHYGFDEGPFGEAEKVFLSTATSLDGLTRSGIAASRAPKVWLIEPDQLPAHWDPSRDSRVPVWEVTMHLVRRLKLHGEQGAAELLRRVPSRQDLARDLAYRCYAICEQKRWPSLAFDFNALVVSWPEIARLAAGPGAAEQGAMV